MKIKTIITGYLEENCYILIQDNNCLIVDPGDNYKEILNEVSNYNLKGILITHYHFDHIGALNDILNYKNVNIYDYKLEEKEYIIDNFKFEIIKTPGHTNDSVTFYFKETNTMFTGDFIFKESIGRTDLNGSIKDMNESIKKIKKYDKNIILYPGHGDKTTIDYELKNNIFLQ